ncbi:hypothetical protein FXO37_23339 [Capsicum annuum]|nr:hypothetical protein FXO37_23339 [Capsicum annuum]
MPTEVLKIARLENEAIKNRLNLYRHTPIESMDRLSIYPDNPTLTQFIEIVNNNELANDTIDHEFDRDSLDDDAQMSGDDDNSDEDDNTIPSHDDKEGSNDFTCFRVNDSVWAALWNLKNPKYLKTGLFKTLPCYMATLKYFNSNTVVEWEYKLNTMQGEQKWSLPING